MEKVKLQDIRLQPLSIPSGWHIVHNHFCNVNPGENIYIDGLPDGDVWELFLQDLFLLENSYLKLSLDLGWVPEADPNGRYKLTLLKDTNWDNPIASYKSPSKNEIVKIIDSWLHLIAINELDKIRLSD